MPRRKQSLALRKRSILCLADIVAHACKRISQKEDIDANIKGHVEETVTTICDFVKKIPEYAADDYVMAVLEILSYLNHLKYLRVALHPQCRKLEFNESTYQKKYRTQLVLNLDKVCTISHLQLSSTTPMEEKESEAFTNHIGKFQSLVSLTLDKFLCTADMMDSIAQNCLHLEKLHVDDASFQSHDVKVLINCKKLKSFIYKKSLVNGEDTVYLLDNLSDLEDLNVGDIEGVLETLIYTRRTHGYRVKSCDVFYWSLPSNHLELLHMYFPKLEELNVAPVGGLEYLTLFRHLKSLNIFGKLKYLTVQLPFKCFSCLTTLYLCNIDVSEIFNRKTGVKFLFLDELHLLRCRDVDVSALAIQCPKLKTLGISICKPVSRCISVPKSESGYHALLELKVLDVVFNFSVDHLLFALFSCRNLRVLSLREYYKNYKELGPAGAAMNDKIWNLVLENNPMALLQRLTIQSNEMTKAIIPYIMKSFHHLEYLALQGKKFSLSPVECDFLKRQSQKFYMKCYVQCESLHYPLITFKSSAEIGAEVSGYFEFPCSAT